MAQVTTPLIRTAVAIVALALCSGTALAGPLDEMSLERWAKLKEVERFQLNAAERLYRDKQWKAAADEYEKFIKLYERSEGAPFAQLKWSHCQVKLRKQNTAIKDGFQTLLDYFPDSPEAPIAGYLIGRTYRDIGDLKPAKKAYAKVIASHPKHFAAVLARLDLVEFAVKENDNATRANLLRELTFDVERKGPTVEPCVLAARQYTQLMFRAGNFEEGLKAIATTCGELDLPVYAMHGSHGNLSGIVTSLTAAKDEPTKKLGEKLADAGCAWLKTQVAAWLKDAKTKPRAVAAWYYVAEVRRAAHQPDKEKAVYEEMLAGLGADDQILGRLAYWYKTNNQRELARKTYAKFKDQAEGQHQIAVSHEEERQYDKAIAIYQTLALNDPKAEPKWLSAKAMVYRHAGKLEEAIRVYRGLAKTDVKNAPDYQLEVALTYWYAHRWAECIKEFGTARPDLRAHAHRQLKQYDAAIGVYRGIVASATAQADAANALFEIGRTQEDFANSLAGMGRAEEATKRKEDAIKTLKQVCNKYPKTTAGSNAHARLNEVFKIPVTLGGAKD